jgi:hypothetical protein
MIIDIHAHCVVPLGMRALFVREITYTVTKVHLDWLVHLKMEVASLGTPTLVQHTGFIIVGLYYCSTNLDYVGY